MLLEVCAYTVESCRMAARTGAGRVELCADPAQGGTTPSIGMVGAALELGIPVFPMVRQRGGDFHFSRDEVDVMFRDIRAFRGLGCPGMVAGALRADRTVDEDLMGRITEAAGPMEVTFHKAFDLVPDAATALEALVRAGCRRVLTSGLAPDAVAGAGLLKQLAGQAAGRIAVMPGGGVRSGNIRQLMEATGAKEFHSSAITQRSAPNTADEAELQKLVQAISRA